MKKTKLSKPEPLPDGFMFWHGRVMRIEHVEALAEKIMAGFDELPPAVRRAINEVPVWPHKARAEVVKRGETGAATSLLKQHTEHHFKPSRRGVSA